MRQLSDYPHWKRASADYPIYGQLAVEMWVFPRAMFNALDFDMQTGLIAA